MIPIEMNLSKNFTPNNRVRAVYGRPRSIDSITIHWWNSPDRNPGHDGAVRMLCGNTKVSAHYVVSAGRITQVVLDQNAAWHSGSSEGNALSVGIECDPAQTDDVYATVAQLIRHLREKYGPLPLVPHRQWSATQCPGTYDLDRLDRLANGITEPAPPALLAVDGSCGPATKRALQVALGVPVDGSIGPITVRALQSFLNIRGAGLAVDGSWGPATTRALQTELGVTVDGSWGPESVRALQRRLNTGGF